MGRGRSKAKPTKSGAGVMALTSSTAFRIDLTKRSLSFFSYRCESEM